MLIRLTESLLVGEECRPWHTVCREEILQAVLRLEDDDRLAFQARPRFLKFRNFLGRHSRPATVRFERVKLFVCGVRFIGICRSGRGRPRPFG